MSRVDFYILPDDRPQSMEKFACKLTEKAWQQGQRILIHTSSEQQSHALDDMLWTFKDGSFIPHAISGESIDEDQPVLISHQALAADNIQIMINLSSMPASEDSHYDRIAEIINQDPQRKLSGREHYKIYRDKGYQLHHH